MFQTRLYSIFTRQCSGSCQTVYDDLNTKFGTSFTGAYDGSSFYYLTSSHCSADVTTLDATLFPTDFCSPNATNLNAIFQGGAAAGDGAAHTGTCWDGYTNVANVVEAKCSKGGGGRNATWQPTVTSGQCLKPAAEGTPCKSHERTDGTATCDGVDYDFTQILPPGGAEYFTMQTQVKDTIFFDMIGKGLNASVPGCAFQDGHTEANVGGLAVKQSDLCFSIGKVDKQKWYLNGTSSPLNQIISVVFSGGQDGVSTRLEMTCDPDQVEPFFPTTLPLQADPNVVVIPGRSKYACSNVPTRPPSIDNLPYCADSCSKDWDTCIAKDTAYTARQCLDFANKGFLCKTNGIPTQCDATGFLKKQPVCPGQMRFVSCISCRPSCQTPSPAGCGGACAPGCKCPPETPYWDDAVASCVRESDCPRTGDCDQAIVKNYLGMPIGDAFCPSRAQGAVCKPSCERNMCVPRPSFEGRDKYAALCAELKKKEECGARKVAGAPHEWSHRCIWAEPSLGEDPSFVCNGGNWELTNPGSCPIGAGESSGIVGPACRALASSQCIEEANCTTAAQGQCSTAVEMVAKKCKFPCIAVESGSKANMEKCARCVYNAFASNKTTVSNSHGNAAARNTRHSGLGSANVTNLQTCCGCLPELFSSLPGGFIPTDVLPTVMQSPCLMHDPLEDDDLNMDDDEVQNDY
eukprot:gene1423-15845_t